MNTQQIQGSPRRHGYRCTTREEGSHKELQGRQQDHLGKQKEVSVFLRWGNSKRDSSWQEQADWNTPQQHCLPENLCSEKE